VKKNREIGNPGRLRSIPFGKRRNGGEQLGIKCGGRGAEIKSVQVLHKEVRKRLRVSCDRQKNHRDVGRKTRASTMRRRGVQAQEKSHST